MVKKVIIPLFGSALMLLPLAAQASGGLLDLLTSPSTSLLPNFSSASASSNGRGGYDDHHGRGSDRGYGDRDHHGRGHGERDYHGRR